MFKCIFIYLLYRFLIFFFLQSLLSLLKISQYHEYFVLLFNELVLETSTELGRTLFHGKRSHDCSHD